jgi:predicted transcriptional regulator
MECRVKRSDLRRLFAEVVERRVAFLRILFESVDLLWGTPTKKRWEILRAMTGQGALSIRAVGRRVGRDIKAVYGDVTALLHAGILDQADAGRRVSL